MLIQLLMRANRHTIFKSHSQSDGSSCIEFINQTSFVIIDGMPVKDFPLPNDSIVKVIRTVFQL